MPSCIVTGCGNTSKKHLEGISFHAFPKKHVETWKKAIGRPTLVVSKNHVVCSAHFQQSDYLQNYKLRRRLKEHVVPSLLLPKPRFRRKLESSYALAKSEVPPAPTGDVSPLLSVHSTSEESTSKEQVLFAMPGSSKLTKTVKMIQPSLSSSSNSRSNSAKIKERSRLVKFFHSYTRSPSHHGKILVKKTQQIYKYKKEIHNVRQKFQRLKKNIKSLKEVVTVLRKNDKLSTDASRMLEGTFSGIPLAIMKRILTNIKSGKNTRKKFCPELKNFAMTLQFYSPKAYDFVRRSFNLCLPAPSVIRSWLAKVDCEPGYSKPALNTLSQFVKEKREKGDESPCLFAIMIDEMSIKKQINLEGNRLTVRGYVDIGTGPTDDTTLASEALVVMVVCLNGSWKLPIAYFLINKLNGEEKAAIVLESVQVMHNIGIRIVSLTCDGPHVNFRMIRTLGCALSLTGTNMDTYFCHPSDESHVFVFLDVCHMLKLVRNNWAKLGKILNVEGEVIDWKFIALLFQIQEEEGVKIANKLSRAHINWKKSIMKVNLAAQTFSSSVAKALQFMKDDIKDSRFQGAGPTIEFIQIINNLFDLLNSRNPFGRAFKTPLRQANEAYWLPCLQNGIKYLWALKNTNGIPLYKTQNKTPIVGFIVSALSAIAIYKEYVIKTQLLKYILTYKFSQDHLELFFCSIRSRNGWNNNPTCLEFIHTYKRLLVHQDLKNFGGNCIAQDTTQILRCDTTNGNVPESELLGISAVSGARNSNDEGTFLMAGDEVMTVPDISLSAITENVVAYIAGFVIRKIIQKLTCEICTMALYAGDDNDLPELKLIKLKTNGGLIFPSQSVVKVCRVVEHKIRNIFLLYENRPPPQDMMLQTLKYNLIGGLYENKNIFRELDEHLFDVTFEEVPPRKYLIEQIIVNYTKVRFYSLVKKFNQDIIANPIRKQLSKLILFKHQ